MTRATRQKMFYISVILFVTGCVVVISYALGYTYSFNNRKVMRTGSLHIDLNRKASVYISGDQVASTSFSGSYSRAQLLPGLYNIRVNETGYHEWHKTVRVIAGEFTDFPDVVILPLQQDYENLTSASFAQESNSISPDQKKSVYFMADKNVWINWLSDSNTQPYKSAGAREQIASFPTPIERFFWHEDSQHLYIKSGGMIYFMEIDTRGGTNIYALTYGLAL